MYSVREFDTEFYEPQYPEFAFYDNHFSPPELKELDLIFSSHEFNKAYVGGENSIGGVNLDVRDSETSWLYINDANSWFHGKMKFIINNLNDRFYKMDLRHFNPYQLTQYKEESKQRYDWHTDSGPGVKINSIRKLSCVLFLSDLDEFEGGTFEYKIGKDECVVEQKRGRVIVFPSYTLHRVTPVTKGVRRSIVTWVSGPLFK